MMTHFPKDITKEEIKSNINRILCDKFKTKIDCIAKINFTYNISEYVKMTRKL